MGFILNRFDKLMELKRNRSINEQFKLTAIIVHDPNDDDLKVHIRDHFLEFAAITGENFLFITFIQPPKEYADAISRGEYKYAKLLVSDSTQLSDTDKTINPLIREFYNLPEYGSYWVIAKKLSDNEVFKVPITSGSLPYQILDLTSYCNCPQDFEGLIQKLKGESIIIKEMIGDSLLKLVSLISPSSTQDKCRLYAYSQCETAKKTIYEEKHKLLAVLKQSSDDEDLADKVFELYKVIENVHMNVLNEGQHTSNYVQCENYRLLAVKSQKFWNTYSRLSQFIENASRDELDYSAFILYLGKIVETELNLSVCQMLRQSMGIDMPDFYNRYCYKADKTVIPTENKDVPLNKYIKSEDGKKQLKGVPLGDLLHAYKTAVGEEYSSDRNWYIFKPDNLKEISEEFLPLWANIAKKRNDAAHSRSVNVDAFENTKELFKEFLKEYISELYQIKENLRPGNKHS